jgi:hypothetical protein
MIGQFEFTGDTMSRDSKMKEAAAPELCRDGQGAYDAANNSPTFEYSRVK